MYLYSYITYVGTFHLLIISMDVWRGLIMLLINYVYYCQRSYYARLILELSTTLVARPPTQTN
jgi:hypothetical protein